MKKLEKLHESAMAEFSDIQLACYEERLQNLEDRRFYSIAGAQWEGALGDQFENKPKFEINKTHLAVNRIFSEYRNNRITVDFISKDGAERTDLADVCDGLFRADEQDSVAEEAYDNAFEEGVGGGIGGWRLCAEYEDDEDDEDERQRIKICPIFDADSSIFFDLNAKRQDKSDAKRCFVVTSMSRKAYEEEYDDDPASWPKSIHNSEFDWSTPDVVYVAELYEKEIEKVSQQVWTTIDGKEKTYPTLDFKDDPDLESMLLSIGSEFSREKIINRRKIHKYILSGGKVLEDCGCVAGRNIPIVPFYGKRWFIDNIERCMGHVRLAKDAQRLKNMQTSKLAEISALSSVSKPILTPEQVAGHTGMWSDDTIKNYPYLLLNAITDQNGQILPSGPIGYTKVPEIPPAMAALLQISDKDIFDLLGNQEKGEELQPEVSGRAVELVQNRLDMQVFIYMSNMAKAVKRSGEIWLGMARELYVEDGRKMKTIGKNGETSSIDLSEKILDEKSGKVVLKNDLSRAEFDVTTNVGPTSASKRSATVRSLMGMASITEDPETKQVLGAMAMMNMEGEGIDGVRDFFRKKLVDMGAIKPTKEEQKAMEDARANQQPDPNSEYLMAAAEESKAKAVKAQADTALTLSKVDQVQALTLKTASEIDVAEEQRGMQVIQDQGVNK